jgi:hypothetical protein
MLMRLTSSHVQLGAVAGRAAPCPDHHAYRKTSGDLPAGLFQTRHIATHGSFPQFVTADAELAVNSVWTTS